MEVKQKPHLHRDWIDPLAYEIVDTLQRRGFATYLVGGCVRDLLVNIHPKDFDIATLADPETIRSLIRKAYIIGRRFRLVLVRRGDQQFEVATFRRDSTPDEFPDGPPPGDNVFGTPEEDARRRDFTINGLFYDPAKDELIDYTGGIDDIHRRVLRMIGDPNVRLLEDPIRILRALRLAHKIKFSLDSDLRQAMLTHAKSLTLSVLPRRREEYLKILRLDDPDITLYEAFDLGLLEHILPSLHAVYLDLDQSEHFNAYLHRMPALHHLNPQDPTQLFAILILAYVRTRIEPDPLKPLHAQELLDHPELQKLMRDELGMFKLEQQMVAKALRLQSVIVATPDFQRKGARRQAAIIRNEALPLALLMAELDVTTDPAQIQFWWKHLQAAGPAPSEDRPRRKRRRSRRRTGPREPAAASPGGGAEGTGAS
jgi:poly(A) polymerase